MSSPDRTQQYQAHLWQHRTWMRGNRHYTCRLSQNLFGQWITIRSWGTVNNNRGRSMETIHNSYEEALQDLDQTDQRRLKRGYQPVGQNS